MLARDETREAVPEAMQERGISTLDASGQMTDAALLRISELRHVTRLELGGSRQLTDDGLQRLAADNRPRMFGEEALWYLKRGAARVALDRREQADPDLRRALGLESRKWVTGRAHGELGKLADLRGDRATARGEFQRAAALAEEDNDPSGAAAAARWVDTPYRRGHR